ncbi:uncharacterized protein [Euphorbia lathyris]|uniref:uncharacterized protein n=1 Tax=Euphorbia lathyris TaxID=212925 RepID=UPI003313968A
MRGEEIEAPTDRRMRRDRGTNRRPPTPTCTTTLTVAEQPAKPNHETPTTRKRKVEHQCKLSDEIHKCRILTLKEICSSGGNSSESVEQPICGGDTSDGLSWLVRMPERTRKLKEPLTPIIPRVYVEKLARSLRDMRKQLVDEMTEKVNNGVRKNLPRVMNMLRRIDPNLEVDMKEFSAIIFSEDDNVSLSSIEGGNVSRSSSEGDNSSPSL